MDGYKRISFWLIIVMAIFVAVLVLGIHMRNESTETVDVANVEVNITPVTRGTFTLFQYTNVGWTNVEYVTEYYIKDQFLHYKTRDGKKNFCDTNSFVMVEGYIEGEIKINYGFYTWDYE